MKIPIFCRLVRYIVTYHFLSSFIIFLVVEVDAISGRSEIKTKLLLQNIRTHLAQKVDEIVQQKECESGLTLCKIPKNKEDEDKSEEIPPPPKLIRGHHKPLIKVNPKDVIQTLMPKAQKKNFRKSQKEDAERQAKDFRKHKESTEKSKESDEEINLNTPKLSKSSKIFPKPLKPVFKSQASPQKNFNKQPENNEKVDTKNLFKIKFDIDNTKNKEEKLKFKKNEKLESETKNKKLEKATDKSSKEKPKNEDKPTNNLVFPGGAFFFVLDSKEVKSDLCRKHSQIYLKQLKKYKIWALMMYDASAKLPSGILQGNTNQYGDFDECLSINAVFKISKTKHRKPSGIKGKYCLANVDITTNLDNGGLREALERAESFSFIRSTISDAANFIPRFSTLNWGLCVPSACPAEDVENYMKNQLEVFNSSGLVFNVKVEEENCVMKDDLKFEYDYGTLGAILFYSVIITTTAYATYLDLKGLNSEEFSDEKNIKEDKKDAFEDDDAHETDTANVPKHIIREVTKFSLQEKLKILIMAFSIRRNAKKLFGNSNSKDCIQCINGIKSVFTVMLYLAHKTIPLGMTAFSNRIALTKISNESSTVLLRASVIYTDSFLLLSGILTSYNYSKEISEKGYIPWLKKSIARFIRLTPPQFAVLLFYAYIWSHLGSGPIWNVIIKKNSELCRKYMWRNLLYIQNFFAFENMCAPQTHQLALDMQLSLLAPVFVYLLYKYDKIGIGILQALLLTSSIMRYISTSNNELSLVIYHGMSVSQLYRTANLLYSQTLHRSSPYILGAIVGYYLRKFEGQVDVPKAFTALGWIIAFSLGFYSIVSPSHLASRSYQYDLQESAQYAALSPVAWSLALSWLVVTCHSGNGGKLNEFLSQKSLLIFSRISYSVYLTQFLVFFYTAGIKRVPEIFTFTGSFDITEFVAVIAMSVIVSLLFDMPMIEIKKIFLNGKTLGSLRLADFDELKSQDSSLDTSEQSSQIEEDSISQEESQEIDDIEYLDEDIEETGNENIENENGDEIEDESYEKFKAKDEKKKEEDKLEMQPLRRSSRMQFDDEFEDKEWFKVEDDINESEAQVE